MRRPLAAPLLCCLLLLCACAAKAPAGESAPPAHRQDACGGAAALVEDSARVLLELRRTSPHGMLDAALEDARGLVILQGVVQAGFIFSLHGGGGVLLARRPDGGWGAPVLVGLAGAGCGVQAGLARSRAVLALLDEATVERVLDGRLDFEAAAWFDILGVREEAARGSLTTGRPVLAFSDGLGAMAGVAFRGTALLVDGERTRAYHGTGDLRRILRGTSAPGLEVFQLWSALVLEPPGPDIARVAPAR